MCQAFHAVNAATQVPAFPSGDLKTKQQAVAGKQWASIIDLAARYYAIKMDEEAVPYTAFHVEGQGFYIYLWMPDRCAHHLLQDGGDSLGRHDRYGASELDG